MEKPGTSDLLDVFREMTLPELSDFLKSFEDTFGVKAAVPAAVQPPGPAVPAEPAAEEKDEWDVILEAVGEKKIQVIKEVRVLTRLGLKDAKDMVDSAPKLLLENVSKQTADAARTILVNAGATVTVK